MTLASNTGVNFALSKLKIGERGFQKIKIGQKKVTNWESTIGEYLTFVL